MIFDVSEGMENCKMSGKSQGILRWMISGNPVLGLFLLFPTFLRKLLFAMKCQNNLSYQEKLRLQGVHHLPYSFWGPRQPPDPWPDKSCEEFLVLWFIQYISLYLLLEKY